MNPAIKKSVTVPLSPDAAFDLFTNGIDKWWPHADRTVSGKRRKVTFPKSKGGEISEETEEGRTILWGHVIAYDPGRYLAFTWFRGKSRDDATVVTVTFTETENGTQCDLTHGTHDILGECADAVSSSYLRGWEIVLGSYCAAARRPAYA